MRSIIIITIIIIVVVIIIIYYFYFFTVYFCFHENKISTQFGQHKLSILRKHGLVYECQILIVFAN